MLAFNLHRSLKDNDIGGYYDYEGDFHTDSSGMEKLAEALKINSALQTLEYAAILQHPTVPYCQQPPTERFDPRLQSWL